MSQPNAEASPPAEPGAAPTRTRPGGRSERIRRAVAQACLDLLAEGTVNFSPVEVAQRSGVNRGTIYRWWPTQTDMLREALNLHTRRLDPPDTGSWPGDIHALAAQLAAFFSDPIEVTQNAIMASGAVPEFNDFLLEYYEPLLAAWRRPVERAITRGEVAPDTDPALVINMLAAPLLLTPLMLRRPPTPGEVLDIADLIIRGTSRT